MTKFKKIDSLQGPYQAMVDKASVAAEKNVHYVQMLETGQEALLSRIHLIRHAKQTIFIQTFIWTNDECGRFVFYEILEAAKRGVKVKILIDQWASNKDPQFVAFIATAHKNIEVKYYNACSNKVKPSKWNIFKEMLKGFRKVNQRMHNKTFIVDHEVCITGGRNYENTYYDFSKGKNFKDRDVLVIGPVISDILESFLEYWKYELSMEAKYLLDVQGYILRKTYKRYETKESCGLHGLLHKIDQWANDRDYVEKHLVGQCYKVDQVRFVVDIPQKNKTPGLSGGGIVTDELKKFFLRARKSILVQTPYLVLRRKEIELIKSINRKRPALDFIVSTTSLAGMDNIYTFALTYKDRKLFIKKLKMRIFELKPIPADIVKMMPNFNDMYTANQHTFIQEPVTQGKLNLKEGLWNNLEKFHLCLHAKTFIIDDQAVWIGSYNVDPRSANLNTELALIIEDKEFTSVVRNAIIRDIMPANSWTVGRRLEVPLISHISGFIARVMQYVPFLNIWPFQYATCFELKPGGQVLPFDHPKFYDNYNSVGSFPEVKLDIKEIELSLFEAFGSFLKPIV